MLGSVIVKLTKARLRLSGRLSGRLTHTFFLSIATAAAAAIASIPTATARPVPSRLPLRPSATAGESSL